MNGLYVKQYQGENMNRKQLIARYKKVEKIKVCGQKIVYKALDNEDKAVALKLVINSKDSRILQEIEILKNLNLSNVPRILESGYVTDDDGDEDALYIIEEFINGSSLREILDRGNRFSLSKAYNLLYNLLAIEIELEKKDLLHRDINPNNIMISAEGKIYLIDFGAAKDLNRAAITKTNMNGPFTPGYAPHEQISNQKFIQDVRTDLYQIGVTIFECCSGKNPFIDKNDNILDILNKSISLTPFTLDLEGDAKGLFAQLINMLMAKKQSQRPDSAEAAMRYLNAIKRDLVLEEDV